MNDFFRRYTGKKSRPVRDGITVLPRAETQAENGGIHMNTQFGEHESGVGVKLYKNMLTGTGYYGKVNAHSERVELGGLISMMIEQDASLDRNVLYMACSKITDAAKALLKNGQSVNLCDLAVIYPKVAGIKENTSIEGTGGSTTAYAMTAGARVLPQAKDAVKETTTYIDTEARVGPQILSVYNASAAVSKITDNTVLHTVKQGTACVVKGINIKIAGTAADNGLYLVPVDEDGNENGTEVKVEELAWNTSRELDFNIPVPLASGTRIKVRVVTQSSGSTGLIKGDARSDVSEQILTVA